MITGGGGRGSFIEGDQGGRWSLIEGDRGGGGGVTYRGVLPMHKCRVGRVLTCSWWWLHSLLLHCFRVLPSTSIIRSFNIMMSFLFMLYRNFRKLFFRYYLCFIS